MPELRKALSTLKGYVVRGLTRTLQLEPRGVALITGPPRTGTSALLNWLNTHPSVFGHKESRVLVVASRMVAEARRFSVTSRPKNMANISRSARRMIFSYHTHANALWRSYLIEKEPLEPTAFPGEAYEAFLRNVKDILPGIKIIFMIRCPVATLWSMSRKDWGYSLRGETPDALPLEKHLSTWKKNATLLLRHVEDPVVYGCQFEQLVSSPAEESERITRFLSLDLSSPFVPKDTQPVQFSPDQIARIREATGEIVRQLDEKNIIDADLFYACSNPSGIPS